ncbi:LuxR C-terminal-related transcriptional regulator [Cryptosporangium sp. NPDC051539]|uniref:LuxR C-terminal-related transcriptional regulator n=1 Tax=Cryptosporangium sp. NPDC051539 TaxID=3363962 RepID=UPI0037B841F9
MIAGRAEQLRRIEHVVAAGGALVVHGEAGIGKSTLLDSVAARASGHTVLRACGAETEADLAFSALTDLLGPVLPDCAALPEPQAAAVRGALASGPPGPGDRLTVCVAALGLLRAAALRRPVLALVDDVQWVDASSRECVEYVARRAGAGVAVIVAARDPWYERARDGLPELTVGPVSGGAALDILRERAPDLASPVAAAVARAAAGNPLALVELPSTLTAAQRTGADALDLPFAPGRRLLRVFADRVDALRPAAYRAALVAAAYAGSDLRTIEAACARAGTSADHLDAAEARDVVRVHDGRVTFTHPLVRGLVYRRAPASLRRQSHAVLAAVLDSDQRAWHLASAAVGPDEEAASALDAVAARAVARRAYAAASAAAARAADLTAPTPGATGPPHGAGPAHGTGPAHGAGPDAAGLRRGRLYVAAQAAAAAGRADRALALLARAGSGHDVRVDHLYGRLLVWRGRAAEATPLLVAHARRCPDPAVAAAMYADAAVGATTITAHRTAERHARRAAALIPATADRELRGPVLATFAWTLALRGQARESRAVLERADELAAGLDPLGPNGPWLHLLLRTRLSLTDYELARTAARDWADRARDAAALTTLGGATLVLADAGFRLGDWRAADAAARETLEVAHDAGQPALIGYAHTIRARILAARGDDDASRDAVAAALTVARDQNITTGLIHAHAAAGFRELSADRPAGAADALVLVEREVTGSGSREPTLVPWAADLVEASVRLGRRDDARRVARTLRAAARVTRSAPALAASARCHGLLTDHFDGAFARALAYDRARPVPFERARTLLASGRRLHRARRRTEARVHLREALAGFRALGADAWTAQTEAELRAAGARRRAPASDALTPQELRVADAAAQGHSTRDIAAALFLSPKTIDYHLRHIYRKLGVHSRAHLAAVLRTRSFPGDQQPALSYRFPGQNTNGETRTMSDIVIKDHSFTASGITYFRDNIYSIEMGSYGKKHDVALSPKAYLEVQNRIQRDVLKPYLRYGNYVTIDWEKQSSSEVNAQGKFTYFTASASGGLTADYTKAKSEHLRLVYFRIDNGSMEKMLNQDADGCRKYLRDEGGDGRVVCGLWIATDHTVAETVDAAYKGNGSVSVSVGAAGLDVSATATTGTKKTVTMTVGPGAFAYLLAKVTDWDSDDKVGTVRDDKHGLS